MRPTQKDMFYAAGRDIAEANLVMLELLYGDNPITDDELRGLIAKRPERRSRFAGYIGKRG